MSKFTVRDLFYSLGREYDSTTELGDIGDWPVVVNVHHAFGITECDVTQVNKSKLGRNVLVITATDDSGEMAHDTDDTEDTKTRVLSRAALTPAPAPPQQERWCPEMGTLCRRGCENTCRIIDTDNTGNTGKVAPDGSRHWESCTVFAPSSHLRRMGCTCNWPG